MKNLEETVNSTVTSKSRPRVLIGDKWSGEPGSLSQKGFLLRNGHLKLWYDFAQTEQEFLDKARAGKYDVLLVEPIWSDADYRGGTMKGYELLEKVYDLAPVRLLLTDSGLDDYADPYAYGATGWIEKTASAQRLWNAIEQGMKVHEYRMQREKRDRHPTRE
jgi:DNA-binding NarL/FixJ family response regulator